MGGGRIERSTMDKEDSKYQPHQIIVALDLIALGFIVISTVNFLEINPTTSEGSIGVKLGMMLDHGLNEYKRAELMKDGPCSPTPYSQLIVGDPQPMSFLGWIELR